MIEKRSWNRSAGGAARRSGSPWSVSIAECLRRTQFCFHFDRSEKENEVTRHEEAV